MTDHRRLFAGEPLWLASRRTVPCHPLSQSTSADVVIVGAGISGAFMAHALARRFKKVLVIDRRQPVDGSTVASTSLLQFEIDQPLIHLADKVGWVNARAAWRRSFEATRSLARLVHRHRLRCGFAPRETLYLAGDSLGHRALAAEAAARTRAGLPGDYLSGATLRERFDIDRTGAILSSGSAVADPVQLTTALLRGAIVRGVRIRCPAEVVGIDANGAGVTLQVDDHVVQCRHAIFCTGYELLKGIPKRGTRVSTTWAIASEAATPRPAWLDRMLVWEASDPYLYMRSIAGGHVIVGGEDEKADDTTSARERLTAKSRVLVRKAEALLPALDLTVSHRWTAPFGESTTGLPFIDRVPDMPGCYAVMGFGGNGITYSMIASQIVPTLIAGRPDPDARLYRFGR